MFLLPLAFWKWLVKPIGWQQIRGDRHWPQPGCYHDLWHSGLRVNGPWSDTVKLWYMFARRNPRAEVCSLKKKVVGRMYYSATGKQIFEKLFWFVLALSLLVSPWSTRCILEYMEWSHWNHTIWKSWGTQYLFLTHAEVLRVLGVTLRALPPVTK